MHLIWFFSSFFLSGCFHPSLRARCQTLGPFALPSHQLKTPDPRRSQDLNGEQIIVHWNLQKKDWKGVQLIVSLRLKNTNVSLFSIPLKSKKGTWHYSIVGADYLDKKGIESYCTELRLDEKLIAQKVHPMWIRPVPIFENNDKEVGFWQKN